jgi:hypothetical protein
VIGITPKYRPYFPARTWPTYQPGATFSNFPEHTWALGVSYGRGATAIALNVSGIAESTVNVFDKVFLNSISPLIRLDANRARLDDARPLPEPTAGYATADLNVTHRFSAAIEGIVQVQNLTNYYRNDYDLQGASIGRQSKAGVRIRY